MNFKHIAMVVRQFSVAGGLELYAYKLVEGLLANGLKISVICQSNESGLNDKNLNVMEYKERGGRTKSARMESAFRHASQTLNALGPVDLVHTQHFPISQADIVTFHNHSIAQLSRVGLPWEKLVNDAKRTFAQAYILRHKYDELLCSNASCLIFPSEIMKADYYSTFDSLLGSNHKPYVVAHPGADLASAPSSFSPKSGQLPFNFLFVGRGFRKKGLDVLLSACRILRQENRNFKLLIAGLSKKPIDDLRLRLLGIENHVEYLGFQKDMESVYGKAGVLVLPSRVEPFGMAPIQAMQRGLVPIVSKVSGVAEVLNDNQDALILDDHLSASELASLMRKLMDDSALCERLSRQAMKNSVELNWQKTVEATLQAYEIVWRFKTDNKLSDRIK